MLFGLCENETKPVILFLCRFLGPRAPLSSPSPPHATLRAGLFLSAGGYRGRVPPLPEYAHHVGAERSRDMVRPYRFLPGKKTNRQHLHANDTYN